MTRPTHANTAHERPDTSHLSAACTDATSRDFDCTEGCGDTWEYTEANDCSECGMKLLTRRGEERHRDIDASSVCDGYVSGNGPMFNYPYPLDELPKDDEIKDALADLPLCVVTMVDEYTYGSSGPNAYLGLTGGGMNMAWYICTAYVRLGYLPPIAYCNLPNFSGMRPTDERRLVLAACTATAKIEALTARRVQQHLADLEAELEQRDG
jgi:hypothetical protein